MMSRNFSLQAVGGLDWIQSHYNFASIACSIDELFVLDVTRGARDLSEFSLRLKELSLNCFMPISAGGGIRTMDDARLLLDSGADKLVVNTPLFQDPSLVRNLVSTYGGQCVVGSIDYRKSGSAATVMTENGSKKIDQDLRSTLLEAQHLGVGEIYLTSIDRDGTGQGFDIETLSWAATLLGVPVIASGGVGRYNHLVDGIARAGVKAVATANLFNFMERGLTNARLEMINNHIPMAMWELEAQEALHVEC